MSHACAAGASEKAQLRSSWLGGGALVVSGIARERLVLPLFFLHMLECGLTGVEVGH